ncbi:MAG: phosphoheptose isomerase [Gemmatimonadaceae bacterium]
MSVVAAQELSPRLSLSVARGRFAATNEASQAFFSAHCESVSGACRAMAGRFQAGGRLLVYGDGASRSDVAHVVVEFMHPVVIGKRALPALALDSVTTGMARTDPVRLLDTLGRSTDIFMLLADHACSDDEKRLLEYAGSMGMLTLELSGGSGDVSHQSSPSFVFAVPSEDSCVVQETHEILYHVLWELVHVFLDHRSVVA